MQGAGVGRREGVGDGRAIAQQLQVVALRRRGQGRRGQGAGEFDGGCIGRVSQNHAGASGHRAGEGRAVAICYRQGRQRGAGADRAAGGNRAARARIQRQALRVGHRACHRAAQGDAGAGCRAAVVGGVDDRGGAGQCHRRVAITQRYRLPCGPYFAVQRHARGRRRRQAASEGQHVRRRVAQLQRPGNVPRIGVGNGRATAKQLEVVA